MIEDVKVLIVRESLISSIFSDIMSIGGVCCMAVLNHVYLGSSWVIDIFAVTLFFFLIWVRGNKKIKDMTPEQAHKHLDKLLRLRKGETVDED